MTRRHISVAAALALGVVTLWSSDMFGWGKPKSSLTGEWAKAEALALPWVRKHWSYKPDVVEAEERWPYMLRLDGLRRVLVHHGNVIPLRAGLGALGSYLRDLRFLERKDASAELLLDIVSYFGAYPPNTPGGSHYGPLFHFPFPAELNPRLERDKDGVKIIIYYNHQIQMPPGIGGSRPSDLYYLDRWTLTIPRDYKLTWKKEYVEIPRPAEYQ